MRGKKWLLTVVCALLLVGVVCVLGNWLIDPFGVFEASPLQWDSYAQTLNPRGSKEERAISVTPYFEAGNVFFPDPNTASWVTDLQKDLLMFPKGVYKDTVDALVQGILYLMDKPSQTGPPAETVAGGMSSYWRGK